MIDYSQATMDIAQASGFTDCFRGYWDFDKQEHVRHSNSSQVFGTWKATNMLVKLPNYFSDLNAMADVSMTIRSERAVEYWHLLFDIVRKYQGSISAPTVIYMIDATAPQRAKAFLKLIGKWTYEDETPSCWSN